MVEPTSVAMALMILAHMCSLNSNGSILNYLPILNYVYNENYIIYADVYFLE